MLNLFGQPVKVASNLIFKTRNEQNYDVEDSAQLLCSWLDLEQNEFSGIVEISRVGLHKQENIEITGTNGYMTISKSKFFEIEWNRKRFKFCVDFIFVWKFDPKNEVVKMFWSHCKIRIVVIDSHSQILLIIK